MGPEKNQDNRNAKRFVKKQGIPKNIGGRIDKLPFEYYADKKIDGIPETNEEIGSPPYPWYVV